MGGEGLPYSCTKQMNMLTASLWGWKFQIFVSLTVGCSKQNKQILLGFMVSSRVAHEEIKRATITHNALHNFWNTEITDLLCKESLSSKCMLCFYRPISPEFKESSFDWFKCFTFDVIWMICSCNIKNNNRGSQRTLVNGVPLRDYEYFYSHWMEC